MKKLTEEQLQDLKEQITKLLKEYEEARLNYIVARGNKADSVMVQAFHYAGIQGTYSAYLVMLLTSNDTYQRNWILSQIHKDIDEYNAKTAVLIEKAKEAFIE